MSIKQGSDRDIYRSTTRRYLLAVLIIALLATSAYYTLQSALSDSDATAYIVNVSGRQRMLSQHIALDAHRFHKSIQANRELTGAERALIEKNIHDMRLANQQLSSGLLSEGKRVRLSVQMHDIYFGEMDLYARVNKYLDLAEQLHNSSSDEVRIKYLDLIDSHSEYLLKDLNKAVQQYQTEGEESLAGIEDLEVIVWLATLLALILEVFFIFRPMATLVASSQKAQEQTLDHLEEIVEQRTNQLAEERTKADVANRAKSEFLANMSHEIRTPMNAILGLTHLLKLSNITAEQSARLVKIDSAASYLLTIINDILDLSKIESGKLILEQASFNINDLLAQIHSLLQVQLAGKDVLFKIEPHNTPEWLLGDQVRLRQTILNYAVNAIKFTEQGSVSLRINTVERTNDEYLLRFEVEDTGIGIKKEKLNELFDAFEQADTSTTRKFGGTGLGLAINQNLAKLMGGSVGASSIEGEGSTFWFTARFKKGTQPLLQSEANESIHTHTSLAESCNNMPVLLVDDNEINLEVGAELLEVASFAVDKAHNGREAVEKARKKQYGLILMDLQMPEMDGLEATSMIRALSGYSSTPILAMSANVFKEDQQACIQAGMNDFIHKPVNPSTLYNIIGKWLKHNLPTRTLESSGENTDVESEANNEILDLNALATVFGSKIERQHQMLRKFIPQLHEINGLIHQSVAELDYSQAAFHAHKLKSSSRMMGANSLADTCFSIEKAGKAENRDELLRYTNTLASDVELVEKAIQEILK